MGITATLDSPFFTGTSVSSLVPNPYDCAIDGVPYMIDFSFTPFRRDAFRHRTIQLLRPQADTNNVPGEQSVNPEGLWRRSQDSWHKGAGQSYLDRKDSDPQRFHTSKGLDPWTKWQISQLPDTKRQVGSANTNLYTTVAGGYLYVTDGTALKYTTDVVAGGGGAAFTTVTGTGAAAPTSIASDGYNVWLAQAGDGLYTTTRGAAAATQYVTSALTTNAVVGYVKGRLMVANNNVLYNIVATGVLPTALFTQANTDFTWVGFAEGVGQIYAAGFSGDKSLIYRTAVLTDGTALAAPVVAGELPRGEIVRSIKGYLGFICIGTDLGVRFAQANSAGDLTIGALIPTAAAVYAFDAQDRFVWFGWSNYDTVSTGIGRMDLTVFNDTLTPAYASDLMATTQGAVQSIDTFQNLRVFTVSGVGLYVQSTSAGATSGSFTSGIITYDLSDLKAPVSVDLLHSPLLAGLNKVGSLPAIAGVQSVATSIALDSGPFVSVGSSNVAGVSRVSLPTAQTQAHNIELEITLTSVGGVGPSLYRETLRALVAAVSPTQIFVPLIANEAVLVGDREVQQVPLTVYGNLEAVRQQRRIVTYQEGAGSWSVTIESIDWLPHAWGRHKDQLNGVIVLEMHTVT